MSLVNLTISALCYFSYICTKILLYKSNKLFLLIRNTNFINIYNCFPFVIIFSGLPPKSARIWLRARGMTVCASEATSGQRRRPPPPTTHARRGGGTQILSGGSCGSQWAGSRRGCSATEFWEAWCRTLACWRSSFVIFGGSQAGK